MFFLQLFTSCLLVVSMLRLSDVPMIIISGITLVFCLNVALRTLALPGGKPSFLRAFVLSHLPQFLRKRYIEATDPAYGNSYITLRVVVEVVELLLQSSGAMEVAKEVDAGEALKLFVLIGANLTLLPLFLYISSGKNTGRLIYLLGFEVAMDKAYMLSY